MAIRRRSSSSSTRPWLPVIDLSRRNRVACSRMASRIGSGRPSSQRISAQASAHAGSEISGGPAVRRLSQPNMPQVCLIAARPVRSRGWQRAGQRMLPGRRLRQATDDREPTGLAVATWARASRVKGCAATVRFGSPAQAGSAALAATSVIPMASISAMTKRMVYVFMVWFPWIKGVNAIPVPRHVVGQVIDFDSLNQCRVVRGQCRVSDVGHRLAFTPGRDIAVASGLLVRMRARRQPLRVTGMNASGHGGMSIGTGQQETTGARWGA